MAKGQPDFFGQPTQQRYGNYKILASANGSLSTSNPVEASFSGKGILRAIQFLTRYNIGVYNPVVSIIIDGETVVSSNFVSEFGVSAQGFDTDRLKPFRARLDIDEFGLEYLRDIDFSDSVVANLTYSGVPSETVTVMVRILGSDIV